MQPERAKEGIASRGVYEAPYLVQGHAALIAVDSKGVARKHAKLLPGASYDRVKLALEQLLDRIDPVTKLELVRDHPAPRSRPKPRHHVHPAQAASDHRAYQRRLAAQLAQRIRIFRD